MDTKQTGFSKSILLIIVLAALLGGGAYWYFQGSSTDGGPSATQHTGPSFVTEENLGALLITVGQARTIQQGFADSGVIPVRDISDPFDLTFGDFTAPNPETDVVATRGMAVEFSNTETNDILQHRVYWFASSDAATAAYGQVEKKFDVRLALAGFDFTQPVAARFGDEAKRYLGTGILSRQDVLFIRQRNVIHVIHVHANTTTIDALWQGAAGLLEKNFLALPPPEAAS